MDSGTAVEWPLGMSTADCLYSSFDSVLPQFQFSAVVHPGGGSWSLKHWVPDTHVEICIEFVVLGFMLAQLWLLQAFWQEKEQRKICLSNGFFAFQIQQINKKLKI